MSDGDQIHGQHNNSRGAESGVRRVAQQQGACGHDRFGGESYCKRGRQVYCVGWLHYGQESEARPGETHRAGMADNGVCQRRRRLADRCAARKSAGRDKAYAAPYQHSERTIGLQIRLERVLLRADEGVFRKATRFLRAISPRRRAGPRRGGANRGGAAFRLARRRGSKRRRRCAPSHRSDVRQRSRRER